MEAISSRFYSKLYSASAHSPAREGAMEEALSHINSCLSEDMKESLCLPITLLELELALKTCRLEKLQDQTE
jgi:hypothetical protein